MSQQAVDFSLLSLLVDMGFEQQRATSALLATNNASIDSAIDYMNKNTVLVSNTNTDMASSNPIEEYKKQQQAKFDAEKNKPKPAPVPAATKPTTSGIPDTTILASELKLRGDNEVEKQRFEEKLRQQEMEARAREKEAKRKQLMSLRTQLKAEKKDRLEKKQPSPSSTTTTTTATPAVKAAPAAAAQEATLQIRLPDGSILKHTTYSNATLMNVAQFIMSQNQDVSDGAFTLVVPFPRKEFGADELETVTLMQALGAPRGQIVVQKTKSKGVIVKGDGPVAPVLPTPVPFPHPNIDTDTDEPMTGDNDEQQLLCSTPAWYLSTEEVTTQTVLIFRPDNFAFPTDKEARPMMSFKGNMNVTARDSSNMTQTGAYKLKVDAGICQLEIHMVSESVRVFDVVSITDEILVLQVAE